MAALNRPLSGNMDGINSINYACYREVSHSAHLVEMVLSIYPKYFMGHKITTVAILWSLKLFVLHNHLFFI